LLKTGVATIIIQDMNIVQPKGKDRVCELFDFSYNESAEVEGLDYCYLLKKKFDNNTGSIIYCYVKDFFKNDNYVTAMEYILTYNTGIMSRELSAYGNWRVKRFLNDISYIRLAAGYKNLGFFDKKIPPTKLAIKYLPFVIEEKRDIKVLKIVDLNYFKLPASICLKDIESKKRGKA